MTITRRGFLQALGTAIGASASGVALPSMGEHADAHVIKEDLSVEALSERIKADAAFAKLQIIRVAVEHGTGVVHYDPFDGPWMRTPDRCKMEVEAYFDNETAPLLAEAYAKGEPIMIDVPVLRAMGIPKQAWRISNISWSAAVNSLITANFKLVPASGKLIYAAPTDEPLLGAMKVPPKRA